VFDLLAYLIKNRGRVASKDDLIAAVWGGRIVSESALTTRINEARCAIDDSGAEQRLIKTFARKGLRFVGTVREEAKPETAELSIPDKPSIAVLPFSNMSASPEEDYFCGRHGRGNHHGPVTLRLAVRDRAELLVRLQRQGS
jgi:DNA-binding winged helix-turn-helix (wHTH) protein